MENTYLDSSILIGMATPPYSVDLQKFYETEIKDGIFGIYRNEIINDTDPMPEEYYKPKAYYLFGDFDLAIISLIDDFELGCQYFRPINLTPERSIHFDYQVITGCIPCITKKHYDKFIRELYNTQKNRQPLISFTKLKIHSGLLIGRGGEFINTITTKIMDILNDTNFLIVETFCNSELSVTILDNSYLKITELLLKLRDIKVKDLIASHSERTSLLEQLTIYQIIECKQLEDLHVFTFTHTTFGYDLDYVKSPELFAQIKDNANVKFYQYFDIKPGHLGYLYDLKNYKEKPTIHIPIGKGSYSVSFPQNNNESNLLPFDSIPDKSNDELHHVNRIKTYVNVLLEANKLNCDKPHSNIFHFSSFLQKMSFSDLTFINHLDVLPISKVLKNRILKMYLNFNDSIQDPLLFTFFIELKGLLLDFKDNAESRNFSNRQMHGILSEYVEIFERAYNNRIHQSYRMIGLTDFSLENSGGIQQLILAYDGAFKAVLSILGEKKPCGVALVSGFEGVDAIRYEMRLNYFHLFQPELFAAVLVKEAANYFFKRAESVINDYYKTIYSVIHYNKKGYSQRSEIRAELTKAYNFRALSEEWDKVKCDIIEFMITSVNYMFFTNLIADCSAFSIGYRKNFEIYSFWFWNIVQQNSSNYNKGKMSSTQVIQLIMRHYCAYKTSKIETDFSIPEDIKDVIGSKKYIQVIEFCDYFIERHPAIFNELHEFCFVDRIYNLYRNPADEFGKIFYHTIKDSASSDGLREIVEKKLNAYFGPRPSHYAPQAYPLEDKENPISLATVNHLLDISYKLLNEMHEINKKDKEYFIFDKSGGVTVPKHKHRREHFARRVIYIKQLWDISNVNKCNMIIDYCKSESATLQNL